MYIMSRRFDNTWAVRKLKAKQSKMKSNGIILSKIKMANIENPLSVFETEPWIISWVCSQNYLLNQICLSKIKFLSTIMTLCKYDHCVTCISSSTFVQIMRPLLSLNTIWKSDSSPPPESDIVDWSKRKDERR